MVQAGSAGHAAQTLPLRLSLPAARDASDRLKQVTEQKSSELRPGGVFPAGLPLCFLRTEGSAWEAGGRPAREAADRLPGTCWQAGPDPLCTLGSCWRREPASDRTGAAGMPAQHWHGDEHVSRAEGRCQSSCHSCHHPNSERPESPQMEKRRVLCPFLFLPSVGSGQWFSRNTSLSLCRGRSYSVPCPCEGILRSILREENTKLRHS